MPDSSISPGNCDAVITALAQPVIATLTQAAGQLAPVTSAEIEALERAVRLQLGRVSASLRVQQAAADERATEERARWAVIDLPQAMRASVYRARSTGIPEAAS